MDEAPPRSFASIVPRRPDLVASLLEGVTDAILLVDRRGDLLAANAAADRILGVARGRVPIADWPQAFGLYTADGRSPFPTHEWPLVRALRGEASDDVVVQVRNDRVYGVLVSVTARPLLAADGTVDAAVAVIRDVTARERATADLEQKTAFVDLLKRIAVSANGARSMEEAFERALEMICTTIGWPFGQVFLVSPGPDYVPEPTAICHGSVRDPKGPRRLAKVSGPIQMVVSTRHAMWIFDISHEDDEAPGGGKPAAFAFPVLVRDEPVAVMEFRTDRAVEPDDRLLEIMANVGTQLGRVVERQRARARLETLAAELTRSNEELEAFAYAASHDLREPLRTIASHLQLLLQRAGDQLGEEDRKSLGYAIDAGGRLQRLIDDLLAYSRVATQGMPFAPTDMEAVLAVALRHLEMAVAESNAVVTQDPLPVVPGDEPQLIQLLQNLLANAIKFRGAKPPAVHVGVEDGEVEWTFTVRDNGIGIPEDQRERLFHLFQRLHTQREYPGSGIGLATCKRIVERHGGQITVESVPGKGSTFRFTIPKPPEGFG
ncbi:MAG TPA: ATP-binding protein [Thermoplasmata archaeon]|nr:ATP-binding protein [Thermoplasmata archaeon]